MKNFPTKHLGGCLRPQIWTAGMFIIFLIIPQKKGFMKIHFDYINNILYSAPGAPSRICDADRRRAGQAVFARFFEHPRRQAGRKRTSFVEGARRRQKMPVSTAVVNFLERMSR
jgi:hypothetical protein